MTDEFDEFARHVLDDLAPMIEDAVVTVSLVPRGETDVKFAVELGLSIMLDKPIIAVVLPGARVPSKLAKVADRIIEANDLSSDEFGKSLMAVVNELVPDE